MNGSLGTKYIPETSVSNTVASSLNGFTASSTQTASAFNDSLKQNLYSNKHDDARIALKKLIDDQ